MAYSFAAAFRTEPVLTYIRDELGSDYLRIFDLDWHPQGVLTPSGALGAGDWKDLGALARLSQQALEDAGLPQFEGSNAWVVAGSRTASGKPLLAGDPHIRFAAPAVRGPAERARLRTLWPPPGAQPLRLAGPQPCVRLEPDDVPERRPRPGRREGQPGQPQPGLVPGRMGRPAERGAGNRGQGRCAGEAHPAPLAPRSDRQRRARRQLRQDPDRHVVGFPRDREPGARRLLPAESRRYPGQAARRPRRSIRQDSTWSGPMPPAISAGGPRRPCRSGRRE